MTDNPFIYKQQIGMRKLANRFLSSIKSNSAKRILVTSVHNGDGKATFINHLYSELQRIQETGFFAIEAENLGGISPNDYEDQLVVVYGPAYFDEKGLHTLPEQWLNAFDTAVILVMTRSTNTKDLSELIEWLGDYGIGNIWPVWNEYNAPPIDFMWPKLMNQIGFRKNLPQEKTRLLSWPAFKALRDSWSPLSRKKKKTQPMLGPSRDMHPMLKETNQPSSAEETAVNPEHEADDNPTESTPPALTSASSMPPSASDSNSEMKALPPGETDTPSEDTEK